MTVALAAAASPELVRLRVLWYSLRAHPGCDAVGAPAIDYARPVVQVTPAIPTTPHGYGRSQTRDPVAARIAAMPEAERALLLWYRAHPAQTVLAAGDVDPILDACANALAPLAARAAWERSAVAATSSPRARAYHRAIAARTWARARFAAACAAWDA